MSKTRRDFFFLWTQAAALALQQPGGGIFSPQEIAALREVLLILIPADDRSKGGDSPGVLEYIDRVSAHAAPELLREWRRGLGVLARSRDKAALLRRWSRNEFRPRTDGERFFVLLKSAAVEAFYTSEAGIRGELGYQGMGHVMEFPDFTSVKAQRPPGYQPRLRERA
jgi:hypothetical protein